MENAPLVGAKEDFARFWAKTKVDGGCIVWIGGTGRKGYGSFTVNRRQEVAHRWLYMHVVVGKRLPTKMFVMHTCDNPACVKLQHLSQGTAQQNNEDAKNKGRTAKGEDLPQAKLTEADIQMIRRMLAVGISRQKIALVFGVSRTLIIQIAHDKIWAHVSPT